MPDDRLFELHFLRPCPGCRFFPRYRETSGGIEGGWQRHGVSVRTIIALTRVFPACTIDPADWAAARDEEAATPMASKGSEENIVMASLYGEETVEVS